MPPRRVLAVLCCAVLAATAASLVAQQPATAAPEDSTITIFLKAPQPAALDQLALRHDLSRSARLAALRTLVPDAATYASVTGLLARSGYRVIDQTSWSITAVGTAATSARLFGTRPAAHASRAAVTGALPRVPLQLQRSVAAVFPTTGGPAAFHHHATSTLDGSAFRNAYTPAHVSPSSGQNDGNATVATLQLANFYGPVPGNFANSTRAADLTAYAERHHISDPVNGPDKRYVAVKVDGGPRSQDDSANGNSPDVEVDLDQQSILSTAPSAHQQAYFAPNTDAGYDDVFAHVLDDVTGKGTHNNPNIVAMSVSWGGCESDTGRKSIDALEPILKSLVAAGVTVFASAGDSGIYDCFTNTKASVDYPASSPSVVGVGGTHLSAGANRPNTGSNWTETAWTCGGLYSCTTGGTGGGRSDVFAAPIYQRAGIDDAPFRNNARRLVPDIAANGSPKSGFRIYTSDPNVYEFDQCACRTPAIGGTSLSSPVSAASLTNALAARGRTTGVGDIHGPLYSAYRNTHSMADGDPHKAVRDIVRGQNGKVADRGADPSVTATRGYDTVTGIGAVQWPAVMRFVFTKGAPNKPDAHLGLASAHAASGWRTIRASWTVSRGHDLRLLGTTHVVVRRLGAGDRTGDFYAYPASGARSYANAVPGATYQVTVQAQDLAHHRSAVATRTVRVPIDDSRLAHDSRWTRVRNGADIGGSHLVATAHGAALHVSGFGRAYYARVHVGPGGGKLVISGNGNRQLVNLHAARPGIRTVQFYGSNSRASRTFTFSDQSGAVNLDAVWITY